MSWKSIRLLLMVLSGSATFVNSRKLNYNRYGPGVHEIFTYYPGAAGVGAVNAIVTDLTAVENGGNELITGMETNSLTSEAEASIVAVTDLVVTVPTIGTDNEMGNVPIDAPSGIVTTWKPPVDFGISGFEMSPTGSTGGETSSSGTTSDGLSESTVPTVGTDSIDTSTATQTTSKPLGTFGMPDTGTSGSGISGGETGGTTTVGSSDLASIVTGSPSVTEIETVGSNPTSETGLIDTEVATTRKPLVGAPGIETTASESIGPESGSGGIASGGLEGLPSTFGPTEINLISTGASASESTETEVGSSVSSIDGSELSPSIGLGSLSAMETTFTIPTSAIGLVDTTTETVTTRRPLESSGTLSVETSLLGSTGAETGSSGSTTDGLTEVASIDHGSVAGPEMGTMETNSIDMEGGNVTTRKPSGFPGTESSISEIGPASVSSEPSTNGLLELPSVVLGSISGTDSSMWTTRRPLVPLHSTTVDSVAQTEYNQPTEANYPGPQLPPSWSIPEITSAASKPNIPLGSLLELAGQYSPQNTTTIRTPSQSSSSSTIFSNTNSNHMQSLLSSLQSVHSTLAAVNQQLESDINSANLLSIETQPDFSEDCHEEYYQEAQPLQASSFPEPQYYTDNDYFRIARSHRIHKRSIKLKLWPSMSG